jgi:hypothetical protein
MQMAKDFQRSPGASRNAGGSWTEVKRAAGVFFFRFGFIWHLPFGLNRNCVIRSIAGPAFEGNRQNDKSCGLVDTRIVTSAKIFIHEALNAGLRTQSAPQKCVVIYDTSDILAAGKNPKLSVENLPLVPG